MVSKLKRSTEYAFSRPDRELTLKTINKLLKSHTTMLRNVHSLGKRDQALMFAAQDDEKAGPAQQVPPVPASIDEEQEDPDVLCQIGKVEIPGEPLKLRNMLRPIVYEKADLIQALSQKSNDPVTGVPVQISDYEDASQDVFHWVENNLHRAESHQWMCKRLSKALSPKQAGEAVMQLVRHTDQNFQLKCGENTARYVKNESSLRLDFDICLAGSKKNAMAAIENLRGVLWVNECFDMRGKEFGTIVAVAVNCFRDDLVNQIMSLARNNQLQGTITIFHMNVFVPKIPRTEEQYRSAKTWWAENLESVRELLTQNPQVECAFLDPMIRRGKVLSKKIALVLVVAYKGYVPCNSALLPTQHKGLPIDVRSGFGSLISGAGLASPKSHPAHPMANNPQLLSTYIGQSVGDVKAGSIGGIVRRKGKTYALSAAHVMDGNDRLRAPATRDRSSHISDTRISLRCLTVKEAKRGAHLYQGHLYYLDAVLLECQGTSGLIEPQKVTECDDACFIPKTAPEMDTNVECSQSGETSIAASGKNFVYFGRTSGETKVEFVLSITAATKVALPEYENNIVYPEQLLVHSEMFACRGGDSGSVIWDKQDDNTLKAVGLLWFQLAEPRTTLFTLESQYLFATPIEPVLDYFGASFVPEGAPCNTHDEEKPVQEGVSCHTDDEAKKPGCMAAKERQIAGNCC